MRLLKGEHVSANEKWQLQHHPRIAKTLSVLTQVVALLEEEDIAVSTLCKVMEHAWSREILVKQINELSTAIDMQ